MTNKFTWNEKEQTYFQKNYPKGWCVSIGISPYGKSPEYQVSDGIERTTSYDFYCLDEALEECARLNKYDDWFKRAPKHPDLKAGYILDIWAELGYEQSISEKGNHERSNFEDELYDRFGLECENWGEIICTTRDGYEKVINEIKAAIENV